MNKVLAINGAYREGGVTDQTVSVMVEAIESAGAEVEHILLRDYPIEFCLNCRECTQQKGSLPGQCVQHDGMQALVDKIEQADGYILASPTNFGSVTALYKRFMERLIVYAYWPWGANAPQFRKANTPRKKSILLSSSAAPGVIGRIAYGTHKQLKMSAKVIGADTVGTLFTGFSGTERHQTLPEGVRKKALKLAEKLSF